MMTLFPQQDFPSRLGRSSGELESLTETLFTVCMSGNWPRFKRISVFEKNMAYSVISDVASGCMTTITFRNCRRTEIKALYEPVDTFLFFDLLQSQSSRLRNEPPHVRSSNNGDGLGEEEGVRVGVGVEVPELEGVGVGLGLQYGHSTVSDIGVMGGSFLKHLKHGSGPINDWTLSAQRALLPFRHILA